MHLFPAVLSDSSRKVHVQAMARNRRPEALAEDVVQLKEMLIRAKEDTKMAQVQTNAEFADCLP